MNLKTFETVEALEDAAVGLLAEHFTLAADGPHAVMLTGGGTPTGIYARLAGSSIRADANLCVLQSDERHVPPDSEENNHAKTLAMLDALGIDDASIMRVHTELGLNAAAERYNRELTAFFDGGGRITLGIVGLGADGHAASLFTPQDIAMGKGRYAIAVPREKGPDRVSVTPDLLRRAGRLVFLVTGEKKEAIVRAIVRGTVRDTVRDTVERHEEITALRAVEGCPSVELWFSR